MLALLQLYYLYCFIVGNLIVCTVLFWCQKSALDRSIDRSFYIYPTFVLKILPLCTYICLFDQYVLVQSLFLLCLCSLMVHVTHQSAVCWPQWWEAVECSLCSIPGDTGCSGSVSTAVHGYLSNSCMHTHHTCRSVGVYSCVCVCRCTSLSMAHFRTTTSCQQLQMNRATLRERANPLSWEFVYKWPTPGHFMLVLISHSRCRYYDMEYSPDQSVQTKHTINCLLCYSDLSYCSVCVLGKVTGVRSDTANMHFKMLQKVFIFYPRSKSS